ncbi:hypothetical protein FRC06_009393 [Ceratobasidium sp. 370]|nr:hypothetical protein FRC06_009393 [Ceratobasidium sp. 370]
MAIRKVRVAKRAGPTCATNNTQTWWNNAQGATPCDVYQSIMDKCNYTAPALANNDAYYPVLQAQGCMCNTIVLVRSAPRPCDREICLTPRIAVPSRVGNLYPGLAASSYPSSTCGDHRSYSAAQEIALNGTSSTTASSGPTSTGAGATMTDTISATLTLTPTETPTTSASAAPVSSGHNSVNAGAIGGGVAGGVVLLLVVIGLLLFWRRRRARQSRGGIIGAVGGDRSRNASASSESSLTESAKAVGATSHYTPHSQMTQLHHPGGSGIITGSYSTTSALATPIDPLPMPVVLHEYTAPAPARSLATSPSPSAAPVTNKVKRVPVRYSPDELAQAEQAEIEARRTAVGDQ